MHEAHAVQKCHGAQQLVSKGLAAVQRRRSVLVGAHVVVQRRPQRLHDQAQVPAPLKGALEAHDGRRTRDIRRIHVGENGRLDARGLGVAADAAHDLDRNDAAAAAAAARAHRATALTRITA